MIVTLTLNPCIDLNLEVESIVFDEPLKAVKERKRAGGKGINVSEALAVLDVRSIAIAPLGGHGGREFIDLARQRLNPTRTELVPITVEGNTRTNTVITDQANGKHIKVNQMGPVLTQNDLSQIVDALDKRLSEKDTLAICGSMPQGVHAGFYAEIVSRYRKKGVMVALDTVGEPFRLAVREHPYIVKPNREELAEWMHEPNRKDSEMIGAAKRLVDQTQGVCLASDGARNAFFVTQDHLLTLQPVEASGSPVGAGDCALAGLIAGLVNPNDAGLEHAFRLAVACGSASASTPDTESFSADILSSVLARTPEPSEIRSLSG